MKNKLFVLILLISQVPLYGQSFNIPDEDSENPFAVDERTIDYLKVDTSFKSRYQDKEHTYTEYKPKGKEKKKEKKPSKSSWSFNFGGMGGFAKVVFYVFLALMAGLVIYLLFKSFSNFRFQKRTKLAPVTVPNKSESDLAETPSLDKVGVENQIAQAKSDGNFPLAVRYYFLLYLEKLEQKNILTYHKDKTNSDYLSEITDDEYSAQFMKLSHLFEYVWYGQKPIDEQGFRILENTFNEQLAKIK